VGVQSHGSTVAVPVAAKVGVGALVERDSGVAVAVGVKGGSTTSVGEPVAVGVAMGVLFGVVAAVEVGVGSTGDPVGVRLGVGV
jgi:hypothetical protein